MRPLAFLFPHLKMEVGGNIAQAKFLDVCAGFTAAEAVSYGERLEGYRHLDDLLALPSTAADNPIFVIHWGPDIARLIERLQGRDIVYVAHSTGWAIEVKPSIPIICVSRNSQGYWGRYAPNNLIRTVPNIISFENTSADTAPRHIDVLVQKRKSSAYLMEQLVPALRERCNLVVLDRWVEDLGAEFRRSKVYLYDSVEHWLSIGATEGFGLPPLEAMACGCTVFSSVNDALSDFLDPGENCRKIRVHSTAWDVAEILRAVKERRPRPADAGYLRPYSTPEVTTRLHEAFAEAERFFAFGRDHASDIADPWAPYRATSLKRRVKRGIKAFLKG